MASSKKKPAGKGHNSAHRIDNEEFMGFIKRIEKVREEKQIYVDDERDIFTELKAAGYNAKATRTVLKRRAMEATEREEQDALVDMYSRPAGVEVLF